MFTDSDVDILTAVNSHIAVSLETARAAQLEGAVLAARQQRDVAEQLRDAIGRLAGILDPDRVQQVLLDIVADVSPAERAFLVYQREDALTVVPAGAPVANAPAILSIASPTRDGNVAALAGTAAGWIAVPLHTQTSGHGVLVAVSDEPGAFGDEHLQLIAAIAGHAAAAYENAELYRRVQQLATTDALTGVANRRHFTDHAADRIALARRDNRRLAAMMIDIDHFKKINDTYGHAVGDAVIRSVADTLRANVQDPDILCRYGGEEFAILTTDAGLDPVDVAERLREAIKQTGVDGPTGPVAVTVSIGIAELATDDGLDALLGRADAALYRAKEGGRDQVQPS
jgi:diguanylate cyclase (GGDEF)-like protein